MEVLLTPEEKRIKKLEEIASRSVLIQEIRERVYERNENVLILITGKPGSGKSFCALRLAELINPQRFSLEFLAYDYKKFFEILLRKDLQKGDVIIWDEPGKGLSADEWYSTVNKATKTIISLFRYKNLVVIVCAPNESWVDKKIRDLFHVEIKCKSKWKKPCPSNPDKSYMYVKWYWLEWDMIRQRNLRRFHRVGFNVVRWVKVNLPTCKLRHAYVKLMESMKDQLIEDIAKASMEVGEYRRKKVVNILQAVEEVKKDVESFKNRRGKLSTQLIMVKLGLSKDHAKAVKEIVEKELKL